MRGCVARVACGRRRYAARAKMAEDASRCCPTKFMPPLTRGSPDAPKICAGPQSSPKSRAAPSERVGTTSGAPGGRGAGPLLGRSAGPAELAPEGPGLQRIYLEGWWPSLVSLTCDFTPPPSPGGPRIPRVPCHLGYFLPGPGAARRGTSGQTLCMPCICSPGLRWGGVFFLWPRRPIPPEGSR